MPVGGFNMTLQIVLGHKQFKAFNTIFVSQVSGGLVSATIVFLENYSTPVKKSSATNWRELFAKKFKVSTNSSAYFIQTLKALSPTTDTMI